MKVLVRSLSLSFCLCLHPRPFFPLAGIQCQSNP